MALREIVGAGDPRLACGTAAERAALGQQARARGTMDGAVNAAAAQQSASASEELHAQTEQLRAAMRVLHQIVDGVSELPPVLANTTAAKPSTSVRTPLRKAAPVA